MGDGIQRKFAVIVNGDHESRHLQNVEDAIRALRREDASFTIGLSGAARPREAVAAFEASDEAGLKKIIAGTAAQADDDDLVVVYVTGHGNKGEKGEGCAALSRTCFSLESLQRELAKIRYGSRIVVMDQCHSGSGLSLFADPKTTVVTQGSPRENVSCEFFSPYFWSDKVPDANGDGVISVWERYAHAVKAGRTPSLPQYFNPGPAFSLSGKSETAAPFKPEAVRVTDGASLEAKLKSLQPGQLALVKFSADWCVPCKIYQPTFEKLAKEYGGRFLMIEAEGVRGSEDDWKKYGVRSFPTVAFVDHLGKVVPVNDPKDPMASLVFASVYNVEERLNIYRSQLRSRDVQERMRALLSLSSLGEKGAVLLPELIRLVSDPDRIVRIYASLILGDAAEEISHRPGLQPLISSAVAAVEKFLKDKDGRVRIAAYVSLGGLGEAFRSERPRIIGLIRDGLEKENEPIFDEVADFLKGRGCPVVKASDRRVHVSSGFQSAAQSGGISYGNNMYVEIRPGNHLGYFIQFDFMANRQGDELSFGPRAGARYHFWNPRSGVDLYLGLPTLGVDWIVTGERKSTMPVVIDPLGLGGRFYFFEGFYLEAQITSRLRLEDKPRLGGVASVNFGISF